MPTTVHLEAQSVPAMLRGDYAGRKFKAIVTTQHSVYLPDLHWSGGSRDTYRLVNLATGESATAIPPEWGSAAGTHSQQIAIRPGFVLVKHTVFCNKDTGLTFYVHPDNVSALFVAAPVDMTEQQRKVLDIVRGYKSSYRAQEARNIGFKTSEYLDIIEQLKARGFLAVNGAITVSGKNALGR